MTRVAAVGDLHAGLDSVGTIAPTFEDVHERADCLLLAGDLTRRGTEEEARMLATELAGVQVPIVAVLGNHDHHDGHPDAVRGIMEDAGVTVVEGECTVVDTPAGRLAVAGAKGFGGGFADACATEFGEDEMKSFIRHTRERAEALGDALARARGDTRVVLLHYAPIQETLDGERREIYPFLGSHLLGEAIDVAGADLVMHGHAHRGKEKGITPGGIPVRNVAQPVIHHGYNVYVVDGQPG